MGHRVRSIIRLSPSPPLAATTTKKMERIPRSLLSSQPKALGFLSLVHCGRNTVLITPQGHGVPILTPSPMSTWGDGSHAGQKHIQDHNYCPPRLVAGDCSMGGTQEPSPLTADNVLQDFTWKHLGCLLPLACSLPPRLLWEALLSIPNTEISVSWGPPMTPAFPEGLLRDAFSASRWHLL